MVEELKAGTLPAEFTPLLDRTALQARPQPARNQGAGSGLRRDRRSRRACCSAAARWRDSHDFHLGRFLFEYFPGSGTDFPAYADAVDPTDLPVADVQAFSIDDAHTTEIDDAFSLTPLADGGMRVGIHIAAPGLGFSPDSDLGRIARNRLSTVYMPGRKITMLPEDVVESYTLAAGQTVPALSLYLDVAADLRVLGHETKHRARAGRRQPAPPRHRAAVQRRDAGHGSGRLPLPRRTEAPLGTRHRARSRARSAGQQNRKDYNFLVDWEAATPHGQGRITIDERPRGSPLDTLVAELMIVANATWGAMLRDAGIPGMYRAQTAGKVRMTTVAAPHEGLGVDCYAWSTSPLRRFADLANQWQLIALCATRSRPTRRSRPT